MYDLIMFDLDGTLTDPEEGITKSVQYALKAYGIDENDQEKLKLFIGPPLVDGFMEYYNMDRETALSAVEKYRERFRDVGIYENKLYPDVKKMLSKLKKRGKRIALATSKPQIFAEKILRFFEIYEHFDIIVGSELNGERNEKAEIIKEVLRQAHNVNAPVMVGDRKHDCIGAMKNNMPCIGVSFGFAKEGELEEYGAIKIVGNIKELINTLV